MEIWHPKYLILCIWLAQISLICVLKEVLYHRVQIGIRKKISESIIDIHRKDWEKSSLPKISPKDKENGIYLSCPGRSNEIQH